MGRVSTFGGKHFQLLRITSGAWKYSSRFNKCCLSPSVYMTREYGGRTSSHASTQGKTSVRATRGSNGSAAQAPHKHVSVTSTVSLVTGLGASSVSAAIEEKEERLTSSDSLGSSSQAVVTSEKAENATEAAPADSCRLPSARSAPTCMGSCSSCSFLDQFTQSNSKSY